MAACEHAEVPWEISQRTACAHKSPRYSLVETSRMGNWQGQNPPTTRRAQPSEQLRHAAMLSLQKRGTARKPKMRAEPPRVWYTEGHNDKTAHNAGTSRQVQAEQGHRHKRTPIQLIVLHVLLNAMASQETVVTIKHTLSKLQSTLTPKFRCGIR